MTDHIDAAIAERGVLQSEFDGCKRCLSESTAFDEISDFDTKRLLLRMHLLEEGMRYLDKCIIDGLSCQPIDFTELIKPKDEV